MAGKTTSVGRPLTSGVVEGKVTRARKDAEWLAKQGGKSPAEVKAAGQAARTAVDPRFANLKVISSPGPGGAYRAMTWSAVPGAKKSSAKASTNPMSIQTGVGAGAGGGMMMMPMMPPMETPPSEPQKFAPGGVSANVDGNATGFRRKKSSARLAGLTSKGTSQFKISGQSARSSGLNIGV